MQPPPLDEIWVAIDVETTGLDPNSDRIIEVGAVKFRGDETIGQFQSLIDPGADVEISEFIEGYTGIKRQDLVDAPSFQDVANDILWFIGSAPIVGHNVRFDLGFLGSHGLPITSQVSDVYDLARVFLPDAQSYRLGAVAAELGVQFVEGEAHRALYDARVTHRVFVEIVRIAARTDTDTLRQIESIASRSPSSPLTYPLRRMTSGREAERVRPDMGGSSQTAPEDTARRVGSETPRPEVDGYGVDLVGLRSRLRYPQPLDVNEDEEKIDVDAATDMLEEDGPLARTMLGFERRPQQIAMARSVAEAINDGQRLIVEAGTGVGKSLAYLLPAALYAAQNGRRVIISTNTINLQEQIIEEDIPTLLAALEDTRGISGGEIRYALLKGRANYLCLKRWTHIKNNDSLSDEDARLASGVLLWLGETSTGDRSELNIGPRSLASWSRMSAQGALDCMGSRGICFLRAARTRAAASHIVVVNHALLLTDLVMGGALVPEYDALIIDEAHHLESEATRQLGFEIIQSAVGDRLQGLSGERGLLPRAAAAIGRTSTPAQDRKLLDGVGETVSNMLPRLREGMTALFGLAEDTALGRASGRTQARVTNGTRGQPRWSDIETVWETVDHALADLQNTLSSLLSALGSMNTEDVDDHGGLSMELGESLQETADLRQNLAEFAVRPREDGIYWVERRGRSGDTTLLSAPLHVGEQLETLLYSRKRAVVMTSATLAANGTLDHIQERTGFQDAEHKLLGSPFDYKASTLVCIPNDMPEPSAPNYVERAAQAIGEAAAAAGGRTMALFTSYAALRDTAESMREWTRERGIDLLAQGGEASPYQMIQKFRSNPNSIILGTASFWEGVDLPGDSLQVLVVARLPFNVPTEPVFEARSELYDNPFMEYALPQAILRLRQGFGRLIRSKTDRGVVIILDQRVISRRYGALFLQSLPPASRKTCNVDRLGSEVKRWLDK